MADFHVQRHGDRWAVREGDATPFFESYTRADAEAEARRRAGADGRVIVAGDKAGGEGEGQRSVAADTEPEPHEMRERAAGTRSGGTIRREQGGL